TGGDFDMVLSFEKHTQEALRGTRVNLTIFALGDQTPLLDLDTAQTGESFSEIPGEGEIRCRLQRCPLPAGQYYVDVRIDAGGDRLDALNHIAELTVAEGDFHGSGGAHQPMMDYRTVLVDHSWSVRAAQPERVAAPDPAQTPS
ncbi:MAG TPA: hypothetical protein VLB79_13075, partial [Solirubrobacterales bacterium]|nr:hypothetical protein [Solirubrobacterales bacterium]